MFLDQQSEFSHNLFLLYVQVKDWKKYITTKVAGHLLLLQIKPFYKTKRGLKLVSLPRFLHDF